MLDTLSLENFKTWELLPTMRFSRITGLFGVNSAGKSSVLQSLLLLKQTAQSADRNEVLTLGGERTFVEFGSLRDLVTDHDLGRAVTIQIGWSSPVPASLKRLADSKPMLQFSTTISRTKQGELRANRIAYRVNDAEFSYQRRGERRYHFHFNALASGLNKLPGRPYETIPPIKSYGFPEELRTAYSNGGLLGDLQLLLEQQLERMFYLGPLRERAQRQYSWSGAIPVDMGVRGEAVISALLAARQTGRAIHRGRGYSILSIEERVAMWLKTLGLVDTFRVEEIAPESNLYRVVVRQHGGAEVALTDVGFGVAQVLPVLTLLYYVEPGSTILLEHPEIHLHPSVQAGLADVILHATRTRNIQVILESHSEHLLRRLQRRIAEERDEASPETVRLYFVNDKQGRSHFSELAIDDYGNIRNWPDGFFGDEMAEMVAMQKAGLKRRLKVNL